MASRSARKSTCTCTQRKTLTWINSTEMMLKHRNKQQLPQQHHYTVRISLTTVTPQEQMRRMIQWFNYNEISQLLTSWKSWGLWAWNCFGRCENFPKSNFLTTKVRSLVDFQPVFIFLFESCFISERSDGSKACQSLWKVRVNRRQGDTHQTL